VASSLTIEPAASSTPSGPASARRDDPLGLPGLLRRFPDHRSHTGRTHPSARRPASPASTYPEVPAVNLTAGGLATPQFGRTVATWPRRRRTLEGNARPAMPFLMMVAERDAPPNLAMLVRRRSAPMRHVPGVRLGAGLSHGMEGRPRGPPMGPQPSCLGSPPRRMNHRPRPKRLRRGRVLPAAPLGPEPGRPPFQPAPLPRRAHGRGLRHPPPRAGRPGRAHRRAPRRGRPDHATSPGVAVAAPTSQPPRPIGLGAGRVIRRGRTSRAPGGRCGAPASRCVPCRAAS
jgi:hypothetical protein